MTNREKREIMERAYVGAYRSCVQSSRDHIRRDLRGTAAEHEAWCREYARGDAQRAVEKAEREEEPIDAAFQAELDALSEAP
jgi:hypothetical protein